MKKLLILTLAFLVGGVAQIHANFKLPVEKYPYRYMVSSDLLTNDRAAAVELENCLKKDGIYRNENAFSDSGRKCISAVVKKYPGKVQWYQEVLNNIVK